MSVWLALETSGDLAGLALRDARGAVQLATVDGPRKHAGAVLPLAVQLLAPCGGLAALAGLVIADGPGSFTGLRVAAAVAKALHLARGTPVRVGSALAARAVRLAPVGGGRVLVATNALRAEAYAGVFEIGPSGVSVVLPARTVPLSRLAELADGCDRLVLDLPPALQQTAFGPEVPTARDPVRIGPPDAGPTAEGLLTLLDLPGGTIGLTDVAAWEPEYGRPVEAQTRWEETHGRPLPHPLRTRG